MPQSYIRNIPLLYIYSVLIKRVSMPIIVLYFLLNNLSFTQIGILAAVMSVIQVGTEVHGGIFADIHGKKTSLILHAVFGGLTMLFYYIGDSFAWFLLASVMYGIAGAFITGTKNAFLYDSLKQLKREDEFKKFNGRVLFYSHVLNAIILLIIPVIYSVDPKLPFLVGIGFFLLALIVASFFSEPPLTEKSKTTLSTFNRKLFESFKEIKLERKLLSAIFLTMITSAFVLMSSEFIQPLLKISGLQVIYFGIIYALMRGITGFGASVTHVLERFFSLETLLLSGMVVLSISFMGFSLTTGIFIIVAILLLKFAEGYNKVILEDEINKNIQSDNRTTILSIASLSRAVFRAILVLIFGIVADHVGVQSMFIYALGAFAVTAIGALIFMRKNRKVAAKQSAS